MLDPTAGGVRFLGLGRHYPTRHEHIITVQVEPTGVVSHISLIIGYPSAFLTSSEDLPSTQPTTEPPIALNGVLTRFDQLCELLGNTLCEVAIALFLAESEFAALQASGPLVKTMRNLRDQMPSMSRRQRLVFRMARKSICGFDDAYVPMETVYEHVFKHDSSHWRDVVLDKRLIERPH